MTANLNGYIFVIKDYKLLKEYDIWLKSATVLKKVFDSEPIYNKKFLKNKIKYYGAHVQ